jgi:hypothetical protein
MAPRMKATREQLDDLLSPYEPGSSADATVIILFEILKELKRLRMSQ